MAAGPILLGTVSVQSYQISTKKKISLKYRKDWNEEMVPNGDFSVG